MPGLRNYVWYGFLGVIGAAGMAVEIVGLRMLAPLFGSSLLIWGMAIATVLAGLAGGYVRGGRLAGRASIGQSEGWVFRQAAVGATAFLWMPVVFRAAMEGRERYVAGESGYVLLGAFVLAYAALLVPSVIFGMVSPLAVQVESERQGKAVGFVSGRISAVMTWGSLLGILLSSLVLVPLLGSRATVWFWAGMLWVICEWWIITRKPPWRYVFWWAAAAVVVTVMWQQKESGVTIVAETPYQHVEVVETERGRALVFDGGFGIQSLLPSSVYTGYYWDYMAGLPVFLSADSLKVLVIGSAASTTERQMIKFWEGEKTLQFTSVELDKKVVEMAEKYFNPPPRRQVIADGRMFVMGNTNQYDLIVIDAYARELSIPFHLSTVEFFSAVKERLATEGILAININAGSRDSLWLRSVGRTVGEVWPEVSLVAVPESCNYILLAAEKSISLTSVIPLAAQSLVPVYEARHQPRLDGWLLTDDRAATDWLGLLSLWQPAEREGCG